MNQEKPIAPKRPLLRLALVRQRYNPYGGAERFVERALDTLVKSGAEVTLITRQWAGGAVQQGFRKVICDPKVSLFARWFGGRTAREKSFAAAVQSEMLRGRYDLVQSHERVPGCTIFRAGDGVHAAWLDHRARTQGSFEKTLQGFSSFHKYIVETEAAMFAHPKLKAVICNSQMVADEIVQYYQVPKKKLHVIYNGVDLDVFHPEKVAPFRAEQRAALEIPADAPVLLFVGSGFERKGVPQLLQAMAKMQHKDAHLLVIGEDRKAASMASLAKKLGLGKRTHFLGPRREIAPWYGTADAFVLPTLYDPCPNAALEALACGLPALLSTTCGAKEWLEEGKNGYVVDAVDLNAMAQKLDSLCELAQQPAAHLAARQAVSHLSLDAMGAQLLDLYVSLSLAQV